MELIFYVRNGNPERYYENQAQSINATTQSILGWFLIDMTFKEEELLKMYPGLEIRSGGYFHKAKKKDLSPEAVYFIAELSFVVCIDNNQLAICDTIYTSELRWFCLLVRPRQASKGSSIQTSKREWNY